MSATNLCVRVDSELKKEVESCLDDMGLNMSTAINMYLKQISMLRAIPFPITSRPVLSRTTIAAIEEGERIAHNSSVKGYSDVDSLMQELNS